jgi:hypothetical protein
MSIYILIKLKKILTNIKDPPWAKAAGLRKKPAEAGSSANFLFKPGLSVFVLL